MITDKYRRLKKRKILLYHLDKIQQLQYLWKILPDALEGMQ